MEELFPPSQPDYRLVWYNALSDKKMILSVKVHTDHLTITHTFNFY